LRRKVLLKHVIVGNIEGKIEVKERRGRRRKQQLENSKETRGYCELKKKALDSTVWRTHLRTVYGHVVGQGKE
jgi:hypothetical protein